MAFLITGAGLVGAYTARALVERGERPVLYDVAPSADYVGSIVDLSRVKIVRADLLDLPRLVATVREEGVETVVHTASLIGGRVEENPYWGIQVMIAGSVNVLEAARLGGAGRVVFCSTQSVYQVLPGTDPIREDTGLVGAGGFYGACKVAVELLGANYHRRYGLDFLAMRLVPAYGYGRFAGGSYTGQLFHRIVAAAALGQSLQVPRTAAGVTEWVYAPDVARALVLACFAAHVRHGVYNVGTGQTHDLPAVVETVRRVVPDARIELVDEPPASGAAGGPPSRTQPMDLSHIRADLGFEPRHTLEEGIRDYVATLRAAERLSV